MVRQKKISILQGFKRKGFKKFLKADDLLLSFMLKKTFSIVGGAHNDSFSVQIGPQKNNF